AGPKVSELKWVSSISSRLSPPTFRKVARTVTVWPCGRCNLPSPLGGAPSTENVTLTGSWSSTATVSSLLHPARATTPTASPKKPLLSRVMHELLSSIGGRRPVECRAKRERGARVDAAGGADLRILGIEQVLDGNIELQASTEWDLAAEVENDVRLGADIGLADRRVGAQGTGIQRHQILGGEHCVDASLHRVLGDTGNFLALTSFIMVGKTYRPPIAKDRNRRVDRSPDARENTFQVCIGELAREIRVGPSAGEGQ